MIPISRTNLRYPVTLAVVEHRNFTGLCARFTVVKRISSLRRPGKRRLVHKCYMRNKTLPKRADV